MTMTDIIVQAISPTENPGYNDNIIVVRDNSIKFVCPGSRSPNQRTPWKEGGIHWSTKYGRIALGKYDYEVVTQGTYGKCFLINGGLVCKSDVPNPQQGGKHFLTEIFLHRGSTTNWRGSAGCLTCHPLFWNCLLYFFKIGDSGTLAIINHTGCACESDI